MGFSWHAGVVIRTGGTPKAAKRIERVLWNDPASGAMPTQAMTSRWIARANMG